ncbi:MAG: pilus assembly protein TadG-related protein [Candidatus Sericytochromatia bacterium]
MKTHRFRRRRGAVAVIMAMSLTVLAGMAALVVDLGGAVAAKSRLQATVDAAVLAGGQELPSQAIAETVARQYVGKNDELAAITTSFTFPAGQNRMTLQATKRVPLFFAPVLGLNHLDVSARSTGERMGAGGPFDFAVFSGSTLTDLVMTGIGQTIKGSAHANRNLTLTGSNTSITKTAEAVKVVTKTGTNISVGTMQSGAKVMTMPDLSATVAAAAAGIGRVFTGNQVWAASAVTGSASYVKGSLSVSGAGYRGTGMVMADNHITVSGTGTLVSDDTNQVAFYSKSGDVIVSASNVVLNGVLYAPNGRIVLNGMNITIKGSVVAKEVVFNGSAITINRDDYPIKAVPGKHVKLVS